MSTGLSLSQIAQNSRNVDTSEVLITIFGVHHVQSMSGNWQATNYR